MFELGVLCELFGFDRTADGRVIKCLTIVDDCTRECVAIEVDTSITGSRVKAVLERLADLRRLPRARRWSWHVLVSCRR